jgi:hypothetical protein
MGATLLVKAKMDLFRREGGSIIEYRFSLAELVANLASFKAQKPHDLIYAILALARETYARTRVPDARSEISNAGTPASATNEEAQDQPSVEQGLGNTTIPRLQLPPSPASSAFTLKRPRSATETSEVDAATALKRPRANSSSTLVSPSVGNAVTRFKSGAGKGSKTIIVEYEKAFFEVCKEFLTHAFTQTPSYNLDILCRPWAPEDDPPLPSWIPKASNAPFGSRIADHGPAGRQNKRTNFDPLVGISAASTTIYNACHSSQNKQQSDERDFGSERNLFLTGFILDHVEQAQSSSDKGDIPVEWFKLAG